MEFLDEDARPRFLFQSRAIPSSATQLDNQSLPRRLILLITICVSSILLILSLLFVESEPLKSLLLWFSLSLLVGPFAPNYLTGGDIRVGRGKILEFPDEEPETAEDSKKRAPQKRSKPYRSAESIVDYVSVVGKYERSEKEENNGTVSGSNDDEISVVQEEMEWIEEDIEILKKQLVKHPAGKPRRWEIIAEAFRGRHKVESVIKMAKDLAEKKTTDGDSYAQFLKKRKPVDKRLDGMNEGLVGELDEKAGGKTGENGVVGWSSGEDIALLKALKVYTKDVSMRWEKIAASVEGKSKQACMQRVTELKKGFRNSKAANGDE